MADHPLGDARARLAAGSKYLDALEDELSAVQDSLRDAEAPPIGIAGELDPDRKHWNVRISYIIRPPTSVGLAIANIVHNFRAALDYLAFELSFIDSGGVEHRGRGVNIGFPLITRQAGSWRECSRKFDGDCASRLPGVTVRHRAMIKRRQPYHRWNGPWGHPLAMLANLDNDNKHRLVQPVFLVAWELDLGPGFWEEDCEILADRRVWVWDFTRRALEPGTKIARIPIRVTGPNPKVGVEAEFSTTIGFRNGLPVEDVLKEIRTVVTEIVDEFTPAFQTAKAQRVWRPRPGRIKPPGQSVKGHWAKYGH